ncbi:MAG: hypothetical protein LBF79_05110 [Dysgonamonadaceae bacterium]|nr:hypothetical protein [Dysgonamonadaceae bacterium]
MKENMYREKKKRILDLIFGMLTLSVASIIVKDLLEDWSFTSYQISEFLINYQGGFVRRGLLGEILFRFTKATGIDVVLTVKIISVVCCAYVVMFFTATFKKRGYPLYIIPLCFFCGGIIMSEVWIRKDFMMFCCFIPILLIYNKKNMCLAVKIMVINLIAVFMILNHEVFVFFTLPPLFFLFYKSLREKTISVAGSITMTVLSLMPCIVAFTMVILMHGDSITAQQIWDSWHVISGKPLNLLPDNNAVAFLGSSGTDTFVWHFGINFLREEYYLLPVWYWLLVLLIVYYISINAAMVFRKNPVMLYNADDRTTLSAVWSFQFICLLPMFIGLSIDYLRVFFYLTASSFAIFLIVPKETLKSLFPIFWLKGIDKFNALIDGLLPPNRTVVALLMLTVGISYSGFVLKTIWMSTAVYRILLLLSEPILLLRDTS